MFKKLKTKLKSWVSKVSEETQKDSEETKKEKQPKKQKEKKQEKNKKLKKIQETEKQTNKEKKNTSKEETKKHLKENIKEIEETKTISELINEDKVDETLKKEVKKQEYEESPKKFNKGMQGYEPDLEKIQEQVKEKKQSFFKKISSGKRKFSEKDFENYSEELEMLLLENNVALEVVDKILKYLKSDLIGQQISKKELQEKINNSLKKVIEEILVEPFDLVKKIKQSKNSKNPFTILFCGINGTGKTTTIAKITHFLKKNKITSVIAAGDTFRAASIEQLKKHGEKLNTKVISSNYEADPASVGFDAINYAKKNKLDVILIDTAGRMHTATNLLREMQKIKKVCKPDLTIFVGESITGNDSTEQVKAFDETIGIDAIILSKADIDDKGGTALSVGYTTNKPIIYLGTGQEYDKLEKFNKKKFIEKLGL